MIDCSREKDIRQLYREMSKPLLCKIRLMIKREDIAAELLQEAFLKAWEKKPSFENEKAAFSWLYRVSHNQVIDYVRKHATSREQGQDCLEFLSDAQDQSARIVNRNMIQTVAKILSRKELAILTYSACDGLSQTEISEVMQCSRKTIVRALTKIKSTLRKRLGVIYEDL